MPELSASWTPGSSIPPPPLGTTNAVAGLRDALSRFQTLLVLGIVLAVVSLASNAWTAVWNLMAPGPYPFGIGTVNGLSIALTVIVGLSLAVLVLIGLVVAILGFVGWRRSSRDLAASAAEFGPAHQREAAQALEDSRRA